MKIYQLLIFTGLLLTSNCYAGFGDVSISELPSSSASPEQRRQVFIKIQQEQIRQMVLVQEEPNGDKVYFQPDYLAPTVYNVQGVPTVTIFYSKPRDKNGLLQYKKEGILIDCRYKLSRGKDIQPGSLEDRLYEQACKKG